MPREPDDYIARANRRSHTYDQGVKGLLVLNGGGALALLTFVTQLVAAGQHSVPLVRTTIVAIAFLVAGLVAAVPINAVRYETSRLYDNEHTRTRGQLWGRVHRVLFVASLASFAIGVGVALLGMWRLGM